MKIRKANTNDHAELSIVTKKSKAFWAFSSEQMKKWDKELTITPQYINVNEVYKLHDNKKIIGYYSYHIIDENKVKLDNLFILPEFIGKKLGEFLMQDFLSRVKTSGTRLLTLDAEPKAELFYQKLGFKKVGQFETSIINRFMPIMEKLL